MNRIQLLLSTSLLTCIVAAQPAFAQSTTVPAASASNQATKDGLILEEVVVTAERRTSTAQKTAASLTVRTGEDMLTQGRYALSAILEDVPGIVGGAATQPTTSNGSGSDNPALGLTIRGIQSNTGAGGSITSTSSAAAIYVDDLYNGIGGGYDIERVEVLRGPQGTLYGRSATAGVVAIHTRDPNSTLFSADGSAEVGNYDLRHYTLGVNIPVIEDKLAVRLAGNLYERDGYYSAGGAVKTDAFKVKALWTPTDNFSALFGYAQEYNITHSGGVSISQGSSPTDFVYSPQEVATGKNNFHQYWANFNLKLGSVAVTYIPAHRTWYQNGVSYARSADLNADQVAATPNDKFITHEVRIHSLDSESKLQWQAGFLYYKNTLDDMNNLFMNPNPAFPSGVYLFKSATHKSTTAMGGFTEGTYAFVPETRLTAGIRYDHTKVQTAMDYTSVLGITKSLSGDEGRRTFNNITYKLRLEHDLTPRNLLYAGISTGFSPGDVTLTQDAAYQPQVEELKAQTLTAYEVGSKNRFLDNRLQVNGAVFYYDYEGYQTTGINVGTPALPAFKAISLPMRSYGGELEVEARPWNNGTFSVNGSYTNAKYTDFGPYGYLFSSDKVSGVAPFQGSAAYDHRIAIGNATLLLRGAVRYFSAHDRARLTDAQAAAGGSPYARVDAQTVGDLSATLMFGLHYSITAYARNITDERFLPEGWAISDVTASTTGGPPKVSADRAALSDPRTIGVVFNFKY